MPDDAAAAAAWSAAGVLWPRSAIGVIAAAAVFGLATAPPALAFRFVAALSVAGAELELPPPPMLLLFPATKSVSDGFAAAAADVC